MKGILAVRSARPDGAARTTAVAGTAELVVPIALALWFGALLMLTWNTWGDVGRDTGYDLLAATRTARGELPYVDYVYYYGPLGPLGLGALTALAGEALTTSIVVGLVLAAVIVVLTYSIAKRLAGPIPGGLAAALAATSAFGTGNNSYVLPHALSGPLAIAFVLVALYALLAFASSERRSWLVAAGVAGGLLAITRIEIALPFAGVLGVWSVARLLDRTRDHSATWREIAALMAPMVLIPVVVYGAFAAAVGPHTLAFENLYPRSMLEAAGNTVLKSHAPLTAGSVATLLGLLAVWVVVVAALRATDAVPIGPRIALAAALIAALATAGVTAARPETVRYYLQYGFGWLPAGAWLAFALLVWRSSRVRRWSAEAQGPLLVTFTLGALTITQYSAFYPHERPGGPQSSAYLMPLIAIFVAWLHVKAFRRADARRAGTILGAGVVAVLALANFGLVRSGARDETFRISAQHGTLSAPPADGGAFQGAVDAIERHTRAGDPILVAPQLTTLYTLTGRTDPLPELSLLPGALATPVDEQRAIADMANVRLVITDRKQLTSYGHRAFGETFDRVLAAWIRRDFRRVETVKGSGPGARALDVWVRSAG